MTYDVIFPGLGRGHLRLYVYVFRPTYGLPVTQILSFYKSMSHYSSRVRHTGNGEPFLQQVLVPGKNTSVCSKLSNTRVQTERVVVRRGGRGEIDAVLVESPIP